MPGCGRAYDAIALAEYGFDRDWAAVVVCLGIDSGITADGTYIFECVFAFVGSSVGSQFVLLQSTFV